MECTAIKDKYNVMESDQAKGVNTIVVLQLFIIRKVYHQDTNIPQLDTSICSLQGMWHVSQSASSLSTFLERIFI